MAEWPDSLKPIDVMNVLAHRVPELEVLGPPVGIQGKSPMKYAVDYKLVDSDGLIIEDTDYFIMREQAWDRLMELNDLSGLEGMITIRSL